MELLIDSQAEFEEVSITMEQMRVQHTQENTKAYRVEYNKVITLNAKFTRNGVEEKIAKLLATDINAYNCGSKAFSSLKNILDRNGHLLKGIPTS